ncbi:MAG TPA: hypothetical protein VE869_01255 [Gemmatimonas sp.]|nr:hypothetical protein [Gemmatimonas sp.]
MQQAPIGQKRVNTLRISTPLLTALAVGPAGATAQKGSRPSVQDERGDSVIGKVWDAVTGRPVHYVRVNLERGRAFLTDEATELWIWRSNGTRMKVQSAASTNFRPSWSGDGQSLAFITITRVNGSVYVENWFAELLAKAKQ